MAKPENNRADYKETAKQIRRTVLDMVYQAQSSHIGSNFSVVDLATVLYLRAKFIPWEERDRIIWSKGWAAATAYALLAYRNVIPEEDLKRFNKDDDKYLGLVEPSVKGIEAAGGAMGHGLPIGVGMALGAKRAGKDFNVYVIMSDGEVAAGTTWESLLFAGHHKLNNLTVIIDNNKLQAMGRTDEVLDFGNLEKKFNDKWGVYKIDGHDVNEIDRVLDLKLTMPKLIVADTIKGKGVKEFEDKIEWHYKNIPEVIYEEAKKEL